MSSKAVGRVNCLMMNDQNCTLFNWNVRGLNNTSRRTMVRDYVQDTKSTIVCLQETKLNHIDDAIVVETLGHPYAENYAFLPAQGTRGGVLIATH